MKGYKNVDEYIANFPEEIQKRLKEIRKTIKEEAPEAGEKISYGIPSTILNGKYFIYFAGYKNHISLYPVTPAMETSIKEIPEYRTGKGTLQFPIDKPLPVKLIKRIVKVRLKEE